MATTTNEPPNDNEPVSPINFAGGALYQKPKQDPTIEPQNIDNSPTSGYIVVEGIEKIVFLQHRKLE